jgi:hypothetical protein
LSHGRALLADYKATRVFTADMREPQAILAAPGLRELIDFSRPVAVLFVAVLHFALTASPAARAAPGPKGPDPPPLVELEPDHLEAGPEA